MEEKRIRLNTVNQLQDKIQKKLNSKYLNKEYDVLVEGKNRDMYFGRTEGDKLVYLDDLDEKFIGEIIKTLITEYSPYSLNAEKI